MNKILDSLDTDQMTDQIADQLSSKSGGRTWVAALVVIALAGAAVAFMKRRKADDSAPQTSTESGDKSEKPVGDVMGSQRRPSVNASV